MENLIEIYAIEFADQEKTKIGKSIIDLRLSRSCFGALIEEVEQMCRERDIDPLDGLEMTNKLIRDWGKICEEAVTTFFNADSIEEAIELNTDWYKLEFMLA